MTKSLHPLRLLIIGSGGHARVIADCLQVDENFHLAGFFSLENSKVKNFENVPHFTQNEQTMKNFIYERLASHFVMGIGRLEGGEHIRDKLFNQAVNRGLVPQTVVSKHAFVSSETDIGNGTVIFPTASVNIGTRIEDNCIINTGANLDHDCYLAESVHIAPGATLSGGVKVGSRSHIGLGASILQNISIGANVTIGAGSVVTHDIADGSKAYGVPARIRN